VGCGSWLWEPSGQVLATNHLNEPILATPALSHGRLLLRTAAHLFCATDAAAAPRRKKPARPAGSNPPPRRSGPQAAPVL